MESSDDLHNKIATMKQSFFDEGFLSPSQFQQLERLQDRNNPNFLKEIFSMFFTDTTRQFSQIEQIVHKELVGTQREVMNRYIHRLKGSVVSIGAVRILNEVNKMIEFLDERNLEGMIATYEKVKVEKENLRVKVEPYLQLLSQVELSSKESEDPK